MKKIVAAVACSLALSTPAAASLTPSEAAQVREFVQTAQPPNAARLRALVARADLTNEESGVALEAPMAPVVFNDTRSTFLREVVFGGASLTSRSVLVVAAVRGALARANEVLARYPADLDQHADALVELQRIYGFLDGELASTGGRRGFGKEPQTGISLPTYEECARLLAQHIAQHTRWLRADAVLSPAALKVRAQVELALVDFMNEGPTWRIDAADRLGLRGARRAFFTELGLLLFDSGKGDDAKVERLRRVLGRVPAVRVDTSGVFFGDPRPGLRARGAVVAVKGPLESASGNVELFTDEVEPGPIDGGVADLALTLSELAVKRTLDNRPELRLQTERDLRQATGDAKKLLGNNVGLSPEPALASAVRLLVLDARRTMELAFSRFLSGSPESVAILVDALGVLAAFSDSTASPSGLSLALGKLEGPEGGTETTLATAVRLAPTGSVTTFTVANQRWEITRGDSGVVTGITRDGKGVTMSSLSSVRLRPPPAAPSLDAGIKADAGPETLGRAPKP